jgi:hypothetical protein
MLNEAIPGKLMLSLLMVAVFSLANPAQARARSCSTVQLFLYNLTNNQITATWRDVNGNTTTQPVAGQNILYIGPECINVSGENPLQLSIADPSDFIPNASYTINEENCRPENWLNALSNYPNFCWAPGGFKPDTLSYYIYKDNEYICLQGSPSPNAALGVNPLSTGCNLEVPAFSYSFNNPNGPFSWPIALGTYEPTAGQGLGQGPVFPGLSPSGVTPCIGTVCDTPNHDNDYNYWPVTIYWYPTSGGGGALTYNSSASFQLNNGYSGVNIPSHLSAYAYNFGDDSYVPPSVANIPNFPAPCWPTFDINGNLSSCSPSATNVPAYVADPNRKTGTTSALKISNDVVRGMVDVVTLWGVF